MHLSVIIVNYNVRHFLEQCLCSVQKALTATTGEIIVVDNASSDDSMAWLRPRFPTVRFIESSQNLGFAKACNLGLQESRGEYILFLNPDTLVPEDCFTLCLDFMQTHPDAGAIGVRMLDGSGRFLPESKRAFPAPLTSFYKLIGLSRFFPRSKTFSRYHLGHLNENENHVVDVLAGAFMLIPKKVLDQTGSFDESFFMYGEDVDLSYRIQQAGYKNYYFAGTSIIHFKGESTRKSSTNYVRMFYRAMSIFVRKHYGGSRAGVFNLFIQFAIWTRAGLSALSRFIRRIGLPLIDAGLIFLSFWIMKNLWSHYVRTDIVYERRLLLYAFPLFALCYLLVAYYAGLYDKGYRQSRLVRSTIIATLVLLSGYALLPESLRFSRGIVLFGALLAFIMITVQRWILVNARVLSSSEATDDTNTTFVAGTAEEYEAVMKMLRKSGQHQRILGRLGVNENDKEAAGSWTQLQKIADTIPFREVIFCEGTISFRNIIDTLPLLPATILVKIHAAGSDSIVGSNSKDSSGETLSEENHYALANPYNKRQKRLIDVCLAISGLIFFPISLFVIRKPVSFWANCFRVLFARKTWVGYAADGQQLPPLRPAVIGTNGKPTGEKQMLPMESLRKIDKWYALDYKPASDLNLLRQSFRHLGGA